MTENAADSKDEIELIDFLRVVWKRKYLIIGGTLLFTVIAGIISYQMKKVYRIDMVVRPGILLISTDGKNTYIDSPENIKALIEAGTFDEKIIKNVNNTANTDVLIDVIFEIEVPRNSHMLRISYETSDINQGLDIMSYLSTYLLAKYDELVRYYISEYNKEINIKKAQVVSLNAQVLSAKERIKHLQKRIDELKSEVELISKNTIALMNERDKLISNQNADNILSAILYTNTIQQNLTLANTYKNEINKYSSEREKWKVSQEETQSIIRKLSEEMQYAEFKKNNVQNIQILQPPTSSPRHIRPRTRLNVVIAFVAGLVLMTFLAVFLEYLGKQKTGSVR